jgi:hypothetical protein
LNPISIRFFGFCFSIISNGNGVYAYKNWEPFRDLVHDINGGSYNGAPYDPIVSSAFYWKGDFDKTGTDPITATSVPATTITSFGNRSYLPYLI